MHERDDQSKPASEPNRFERHPRLTMAVVWGVILVLTVVALEWVLTPGGGRYFATAGIKSPVPPRHLVLREWQRNTDYKMATPPERRQDRSGNVDKFYALSTDSNGFIMPAIRHAEPDATIVFLGGSTTECLYVRPDNRFPVLSARLLEQATGLKINGINAARSGNATVHSLLLFIGKVARLQPDYVVMMHAMNDIGIIASHGGYWTDHEAFRIVEQDRATVRDGLRTVVDNLIPYTKQAIGRARITIKNGLGALFSDARAAEPAADQAKADWKNHGRTFESALRSFVTTVRAWGSKPVLMTQVQVGADGDAGKTDFIRQDRLARAGLDMSAYRNIHDYFNDIIRSVARSENALLIDLAAARRWQREVDVYDGAHFTDAGSKNVARIIADRLLPEIKAARAEPAPN